MNNRVLTPMSERSSAPQPTPLIFLALLPTFEWIDRMRLLRYHNYHIGATRAVTGASTLQSCHFQLSSLFKSEQLNPAGRVKQEAPRRAYLSPKSHLRSFFKNFFKLFFKRSLYRCAKSSESIDKGTSVLLQSALLWQELVEINGPAEPRPLWPCCKRPELKPLFVTAPQPKSRILTEI